MPEPLPNIETLQDNGELFVFRTVRSGEPLLCREAGLDTCRGIDRKSAAPMNEADRWGM